MINLVFQALASGLSVWDSIEKNKYIDELMALKTSYHDEQNKPASERDDAVMDNLEFKIGLLVAGFSSAVAIKTTNAQTTV